METEKISIKPILYKLIKKNTKPALAGRHYPGYLRLPTEEVVYDGETKKNRIIRYAPGESSIYKDEQSENVNVADVIFINGSLTVDYTNPLLVEYLNHSNFNSENPFRMKEKDMIFAEYNPSKIVELELDKELLEAQAISLISTLEFDVLKGYARVLGLDVDRTAKEIKHDLVRIARKQPKKFIEGIDDPVIKRQQVIMEAIDSLIIKVTGRTMSWNNAGKSTPIVTAPLGYETLTYFTEWTMGDKEGEKVFSEIQKKVEKLMS